MKIFIKTILVVIVAITIVSCKKEKDAIPEPIVVPEQTSLKINISYLVDNLPLIFDSIMYVNDSGEHYEINKLEYYISNITFYKFNGETYKSNKIFYLNAKEESTNSLLLDGLPAGKYDSIKFNIGIDSIRNISNALPNTSENINMAWPSMMGGGYHFLKLEGHYLNVSNVYGYAIHIGNNKGIVTCLINQEYNVNTSNYELDISMNINEWFRSPNIYSFDTDGSYTMSNPLLMKKISDNGFDLFSLK